MDTQTVSIGTEWEPKVGYSRAVRKGAHVHVAGTTATDSNGNVVGVGDPFRQTKQALSNVEWALHEAGAALTDVIRTRLYVVNIEDWEAIGRAHGEVFGDIRPASSMVEVSRLIDPDLLVEIEAVALIDSTDAA